MHANHLPESALLPALVERRNIEVCPLQPPLHGLSKSLPFIIAGPLKVMWQIVDLVNVLLYKTKPAKWLIVQVCHQFLRCSWFGLY